MIPSVVIPKRRYPLDIVIPKRRVVALRNLLFAGAIRHSRFLLLRCAHASE